jgi:hypothetical protein
LLADNKLALNAAWDEELLAAELQELRDAGFEDLLKLTGFAEGELEALLSAGGEAEARIANLADRFFVAPFSVLNAREGWWQERKRGWLKLGIQSELGRGENLLKFSDTMLEPDPEKRRARRANAEPSGGGGGIWRKTNEEMAQNRAKLQSAAHLDGLGEVSGRNRSAPAEGSPATGTSIFDPVLCELAYRWFSPPGGLVLDPFAGGSVRGICASRLGRAYIGIDLRPEQCAANEAQADRICEAGGFRPGWVCGDASACLPALDKADFLFSCPPYGDLERYSDDPRDLSTMSPEGFRAAYWEIIASAVSRLKEDRFACFCVGDYRGEGGFYAGFIGETVSAFEAAGARLYNEAILVTAAGSLPIRTAKQFSGSRKLGKTHQNILVFCKGDPRKATAACGAIDLGDIEGAIAAAGEPEEEEAYRAEGEQAPPGGGLGGEV